MAAYVAKERAREERIERVVAVISTLLVVSLFVFSAGLGLLEGILAYAAVGAAVWIFAQRTFWTKRPGGDGRAARSGAPPPTGAGKGDRSI